MQPSPVRLSMALIRQRRDYPISEIFGPTRQGEGPQAGLEVYFVRFAGCGYRCLWCDTAYAIGPKEEGWHMEPLTSEAIIIELHRLGAVEDSVIVLSGGDPALIVDHHLVNDMRKQGFSLAMETQGAVSISDGVARNLECLVVSPKPPSSGMDRRYDANLVAAIINRHAGGAGTTALKFVAFDQIDLDWIAERHVELLGKLNFRVEWFISVGTPQPAADDVTQLTTQGVSLAVIDNMRHLWLTADRRFRNFRITPQLHVLVHGYKKGI